MEIRNAFTVAVGKPEGRDHLIDLGVIRRLVFRRILKK